MGALIVVGSIEVDATAATGLSAYRYRATGKKNQKNQNYENMVCFFFFFFLFVCLFVCLFFPF